MAASMSAAIAEQAGEIGRGVAAWAFRAVGLVPIYFAAKIGYHASLSQSEDWAAVTVCTTVAAALLLLVAELSLKRKMFAAGLIMLALGIGLAGWSMVIASSNVAALDNKAKAEHGANERATRNHEDRRADAVERRDRNKIAAAGETEQSALDKIERLKTEHPSSWNNSGGCDPAHISLPITKQICGDIAALKIKAAAAKAYAKAVEDIAAVDAKLDAQGVVAVSTGQTAGVKLAAVITRAGIENVDGEAVFEWGRGGVLELLSAISLAVMDMLAWLLLGGADKAEERRIAAKEEAEERRCEAELRFARELEARAAAEAEEKAKAERAVKRAEAKTREKGDPASVGKWLNGGGVVQVAGNIILLSAAHEKYDAYCRARGEKPVSKGRDFGAELRKLGIEVRERAKRTEVVGLAISSASKAASRGGLRVAFSR